jgi:hypothetical protein
MMPIDPRGSISERIAETLNALRSRQIDEVEAYDRLVEAGCTAAGANSHVDGALGREP